MAVGILGLAGRALLAAWESLPKRDGVPDRASFNPFSIPQALPVIAMIETESGSDWRLRLTGTEIDRRNGFCLTGHDYLSYLRDDVRSMYLDIFAKVVSLPCASWEVRRIERRSGQLSLVEVLRFPLRAPDGRVRYIISSNEEVDAACLAGFQSRILTKTQESDAMVSVVNPIGHQFIDVGAGIPLSSAEAGPRELRPAAAAV